MGHRASALSDFLELRSRTNDADVAVREFSGTRRSDVASLTMLLFAMRWQLRPCVVQLRLLAGRPGRGRGPARRVRWNQATSGDAWRALYGAGPI